MYNHLFHITSLEEKQNKLKRILKSKAPSISEHHLNKILCAIDFNKQYTIKVTSKIEKFKNIVVKEQVETSSLNFSSVSFPIYGEFEPGSFQNYYGTIKKVPSLSNSFLPKAAIKVIQEMKKGNTITSYHLVIYTPPKEVLQIS